MQTEFVNEVLLQIYASHINPKRLSFPQNYQTLSVHPNMSKGKFFMLK
jgi:hypothetical protein